MCVYVCVCVCLCVYTHVHIYILRVIYIWSFVVFLSLSLSIYMYMCLYIYIYINKWGDISTLNGGSLKLGNKFTYIGSSVSSTENDINTRLAKVWRTINMLSVILKSDLSDKIRHHMFSNNVRVFITIWTLTKHTEKKSLTAITEKCYELYWTKHESNIPQKSRCTAMYISSQKPSKLRTRRARHCRRSKDELISNILQWALSHRRPSVGQSARTEQ